MDYEKKIKNALNDKSVPFEVQAWLEEQFPELVESEDERMIKFIKQQLFKIKKTITENYELDAKLTKAIDWLEKQGKNNMGISEATKQKLEDNLNKALEKETLESWNEFLEKQGEQKPTEEYNITGIGSKNAQGKLGEMIKNLKPVNEILEQNYAWSAEDETYSDHIITAIKSYYIDDKGKENPWREELLRWFKSLKDGYTWKPSDEQMERLKGTINSLPHQEVLYSLYQDLKKLREGDV